MALESPSLFIAGLVAFASAFVYGVVANEFRRRISRVFAESRRPLLFFALWWACLCANIALGGAFIFAASLGYTNFPLQLVYSLVQRLLLSVSLVGLMYYLLFLLTSRDWLRVLVVFYTLYFLVLVYSLYSSGPASVYVGSWRTDLQPTQANPIAFAVVNFVMLVVPPVAAALAYFFRFYRRASGRVIRYRVALVSWSLTLWWVMAVVAGQREAFGNEEFQLVNRFSGLVASLLILAAYRPPARLRHWLEAGGPAATPAA